MKKIVKIVLLACLIILPLFALSACSSRSHFATQKDQWQTYIKEKKIKVGHFRFGLIMIFLIILKNTI